MNKYEALREEFRKIINEILDQEFDAMMEAVNQGTATLKDDVSLEDLKTVLNSKFRGTTDETKGEY